MAPAPPGGTLRVVVQTIGATLDADGYSFRVGSSDVVLAVQDSQDLRDLPVGPTPLLLGGLAVNCRAFSPGPASVSLQSGQIARVVLVISCDSALRNLILFDRWLEDGSRPELWMMGPDGTAQQQFLAFAYDAAPTPDGTKVVYFDWTTARLGLILADRSRQWAPVPGVAGGQYQPDVSPDGRSVVFTATTGGPWELYRANLDGSDIRRLTTGAVDQDPRWSPDGRSITFTRTGTDYRVFSIPADGGEPTPLTPEGEGCCARWSPAGDRLLFANPPGGGLWTMRPDGADARRLDVVPGYSTSGEWSPDGAQVLVEFTAGAILRVPLDGADTAVLTDGDTDQLGRWLP